MSEFQKISSNQRVKMVKNQKFKIPFFGHRMPNYEVLTSKNTFWGDSGVCIYGIYQPGSMMYISVTFLSIDFPGLSITQ